jgi:hypothetical protein
MRDSKQKTSTRTSKTYHAVRRVGFRRTSGFGVQVLVPDGQSFAGEHSRSICSEKEQKTITKRKTQREN